MPILQQDNERNEKTLHTLKNTAASGRMEHRNMPETEADGYTKRQMGENTDANERGHTRSTAEMERILTTARRRYTRESLRQSQGEKRTKKNEDTNKAPEQQKEHKEQLEEEKRTDNDNTAQESTYKITLTAPAAERNSTNATPSEEETGR